MQLTALWRRMVDSSKRQQDTSWSSAIFLLRRISIWAGARMLHELHAELTGHGISFRIIGARGSVRDLLRADGMAEKIAGLDRKMTLDSLLRSDVASVASTT
jgi:hypothetical protein